jgi:hypothetical protein
VCFAFVTAMPEDRCPYRRPFPEGFDGCPAFTPVSYTAIDLHYLPTAAVHSCSHLAIGAEPGQSGAYYARCALGTAEQRLAWVQRISTGRLAGLRALSAEYREWSRARMGPLWELKGRLLAARHRADLAEARAVGRELEARADELLRQAEEFVDGHRAELEALGLPVEPLKELIQLAIKDWAWSSELTSGYQVPDELLQRFPDVVRLFFTSTRAVTAAP